MRRAAAISVAIYPILLHAYPREFRRRHAAAMTGVFAEGAEWAASPAALLRWWAWSLRDLFVSASAEHAERVFQRFRRNRRILSGSPGFGAALAALLTPTVAVTGMAASGSLARASQSEWMLLGAATAQVLTFWAAAALVQACAPRLHGSGRGGATFLERVTAFRRLARAAVRFQLVLSGTLYLVFRPELSRVSILAAPIPPAAACLFVPAMSLFLVSLFFTLEPAACRAAGRISAAAQKPTPSLGHLNP